MNERVSDLLHLSKHHCIYLWVEKSLEQKVEVKKSFASIMLSTFALQYELEMLTYSVLNFRKKKYSIVGKNFNISQINNSKIKLQISFLLFYLVASDGLNFTTTVFQIHVENLCT